MRKLLTLALFGLGLLALGSPAQALLITGEIQFAGTWTPTGGTGIADATGIDFAAATAFFPIVMDGTGDYAGLEGTGSVTFNDFTFSPGLLPNPVEPLWAFATGGRTYIFILRAVDLPVVHQDATSLVLAGSGDLFIDDGAGTFELTPADWNFSGNIAGSRFGFSAANNAVPEPTTVGLLGLGLVGLTAAGKKRARRIA